MEPGMVLTLAVLEVGFIHSMSHSGRMIIKAKHGWTSEEGRDLERHA